MENASMVKTKSRWVSAMTLGDMFDQTAESCTGEAVVFPSERITYPELAKLSNRYAKALIGLGVEPFDKVGILLPAGIDFMALLLAIFKVGGVAVPINGRFKKHEIRHVVNKSNMKILVTSSDTKEVIDYAALVLEAIPALAEPSVDSVTNNDAPKLAHVVCIGENTPRGLMSRQEFEEVAEDVADIELLRRRQGVRVRDTALLMFTSGTTAQPKAAMISHEAMSRIAVANAETRYMLTSSDRVWTPIPVFHIGGIAFSMTCFAVGATFIHNGLFNPEVALRQLSTEKCTIALPCFETIWLPVINLPAFSTTDLSSIRIVLNVGVTERLRRMQEVLPSAIQISCFASTEASSFMSLNLPTDPLEARLTTGGHPMPGMEVRIVDPESGADLGPNQRGEIVYRGPYLFDGYYGDPELTRQVINEDGWFHSGDLGELDPDGRLTFKGRLKDMLKVGGENVAAMEVEEFLINHSAVLMAQVVAAPDHRYTEVPAAFIQLKTGAAATEEEIINFCLGNIATYKVPRYVRFVIEWPMSGTKVQKFVLRERIADELKQAGITEAPKMRHRGA